MAAAMMEDSMEFPQTLKTALSQGPVSPLPGVYLEEPNSGSPRDTCTHACYSQQLGLGITHVSTNRWDHKETVMHTVEYDQAFTRRSPAVHSITEGRRAIVLSGTERFALRTSLARRTCSRDVLGSRPGRQGGAEEEKVQDAEFQLHEVQKFCVPQVLQALFTFLCVFFLSAPRTRYI